MRRFFRFTARQLLILLLAVGLLLAVLAPGLREGYGERRKEYITRQYLAAANAGDERAVARALAAGADLKAWDDRRHTALSFAIRDNNLPLLDLLLAAGASPNQACHGDSMAPLAYAAELDNPTIARRLLAAGADLKRSSAVWICVNGGHRDVLKVYLQYGMNPNLLVVAIESELPHAQKLDMVRLLLEHHASAIAPGTSDPHMVAVKPLNLALQERDSELADLLREFGAPYTVREAVVFNRLAEVRKMVEENPDLVRQRVPPYYYLDKPELYPTLLGLALRHGHRELAMYLIDKGAPLDGRESFEETLLDQAAIGGDPELIKVLAQRGGAVNSPGNRYSPLFHAAWRGKTAAVAALIELGADVKAVGPLHQAAYNNHPQVAKLLLAAGADPSLIDHLGKTPLEAARFKGHAAVVTVLESAAPPGSDQP